jgi:zinc transport system ATP-binding protein
VAGLDPRSTAELYQLIRRLNREEKITIIMVSHDIAAAVSYATHILHIGDTVFFGTREEYLESRAGREFLDPQREDRMNMKVRKKKQPVRPAAGKEGKE